MQIIVKKLYAESSKRARKRQWKLRHLDMEKEEDKESLDRFVICFVLFLDSLLLVIRRRTSKSSIKVSMTISCTKYHLCSVDIIVRPLVKVCSVFQGFQ